MAGQGSAQTSASHSISVNKNVAVTVTATVIFARSVGMNCMWAGIGNDRQDAILQRMCGFRRQDIGTEMADEHSQ